MRRALFIGTVLVALAFPSSAAYAAFPGQNGKIAFTSNVNGSAQVYVMNPDGTGAQQLTDSAGISGDAAWSPDGRRIAFSSTRDDANPSGCGSSCIREIYVMDADGSNQTRLTSAAAHYLGPAWSPDGARIAFYSYNPANGNTDIYVMNADGTGITGIATSPDLENEPAWSPDGKRIAFTAQNPDFNLDTEIFAMNPDGSNRVDLTNVLDHPERAPDWSPMAPELALEFDSCSLADEDCLSHFGPSPVVHTMPSDGGAQRTVGCCVDPAWSPDGTKLAFTASAGSSANIWTANRDGTGLTRITNSPTGKGAGGPSWQPLPYPGYARPRGATPVYASLVPAFRQCTTPNSTHGAPLAFGSCAPPAQTSGYLTVGTPDANGEAANSVGSERLDVVVGDPSTPANEADVRFAISITDVRRESDLSPYPGTLEARNTLRITDHDPSTNSPATVQDIPFRVIVRCIPPPTSFFAGSTCSVGTTANALIPGAVQEGKRTIWALDQVRLYDGGADNDASTSADNTLFAVQGVFVP